MSEGKAILGGNMEALDAMLTRRSVRNYTDQSVSQDTVERLLRAAMAAPSAGNQQPWRFIVVRDRELLKKVAAASPHGGMVARAPVTLVVCADLQLVEHDGFWIQDCAAATQNLLLAAHALGLGAVWVGTYPREERVQGVRVALGLPGHVIPFAVVAVGYPVEKPAPMDRYDPSRVYMDQYEEEA
jgi:nitroreductase